MVWLLSSSGVTAVTGRKRQIRWKKTEIGRDRKRQRCPQRVPDIETHTERDTVTQKNRQP